MASTPGGQREIATAAGARRAPAVRFACVAWNVLIVLLIMLGLTMVLESRLGIWATVVSGLLMRGRMAREEKFLLEQFGDAYREYMAGTERLLPAVY